MACLLPQFKCPDPHFINKSCHHHSHLQLKIKEYACYRAQCMISSTTVAEPEKLLIPSFEPLSTSITSAKSLTYVGALDPPLEENFGTKFAAETLTASEESTIEAAASEAVALARAAVEMAKDVAQMVSGNSLKQVKSEDAEATILQSEIAWLFAMELDKENACTAATEAATNEIDLDSSSLNWELGIMENEGDHLQLEGSEAVAIRSKRHMERRVRRAHAVEKLASKIVSTESKKKHGKGAVLVDFNSRDPLRYFTGTFKKSKLLSASEEVKLSAGVQDLLKLERIQDELTKQFGSPPTYAQWAAVVGVNQKTLRQRLNYGLLCKERMIVCNIRLVISITKNYQGFGVDFQDLVLEGCKGLERGVEKFDASRGFKFSTYAHWWIKQAVRKALSERAKCIRIPSHMTDAAYKVREAEKRFYDENFRFPTKEEISAATGLSLKKIQDVDMLPKLTLSLDQKTGFYELNKLSDETPVPGQESPENILRKELMKQDLNKLLDSLNPREGQVLRLRYGVDGGRMKTLQEIGELIGVSRERVRQIEAGAFRKLKNKKITKDLEHYIYAFS